MKNTFGNAVSITLFGESHGPSVGCVIDGLAPGIPMDVEAISRLLSKRRPAGEISTARQEADMFMIESGVFNGKTTGTPICIRIPNEDTRSGDYSRIARPGHADYTAYCKYHGYEDFRGGGHFSGRITAALVAAAGIVIPALEQKGICIGTHIRRLAGMDDLALGDIGSDLAALKQSEFPVLDSAVIEPMKQRILDAKADCDSVGGVLETAVIGMPAGVGEPWFDTVEGVLSHALFSIPAIKGIEFGDGFHLAEQRGSIANDAYEMYNGSIITTTNHNGGINGGITNGMPLIFRCAVKPTPTIGKPQNSVDLEKGTATMMQGKGRHDPCIVHRAAVVVEAVTALVLCDLLASRFGTDWLGDV